MLASASRYRPFAFSLVFPWPSSAHTLSNYRIAVFVNFSLAALWRIASENGDVVAACGAVAKGAVVTFINDLSIAIDYVLAMVKNVTFLQSILRVTRLCIKFACAESLATRPPRHRAPTVPST